MTDSENTSISTRPVDHVTSTIKGVVGAVPIVGPFLTEVVGTLVPNQRVDRIADFAQKLHDRIELLENESLRSLLTDENFTDLLEESLQQVARSTSDERREYIANLVANGINNDDMEYIEDKHLLRILGELNDIEVIWLIAYAQGFYMGQRSEFQERHANVLSPIGAHMNSSQRELDQESLQVSYKLHLEREGLLKINDRGSYDIAPLGRLLVRRIGMENMV
ncbi:hypothetical protein [Vacuolonema iberomarrocanum]|uniref:hypothetical protein n=1 Tax=Vacuolonema iberomarrocanum TaxID=3454632 RepID=UPI0019F3E853|nr:hypothetical protein [filamentous cyanobacterium LEGE 07170]